jgi:chemotaxis protein methyltransferase WspC
MTGSSANTHLKRWLAAVTGLDPELLDHQAFCDWIEQRRRHLGLVDIQHYQHALREDSVELERLVGEVSVPETWFFRYPASFRLLIEWASRWRRTTGRSEVLRMLCVACATGEEPYSMVMAAAQAGWPIERILVDAVDRNDRWLEVARHATYGPRSFRQPPPDWAEPWLRRAEDGIQIDPAVVSAVNFVPGNVLDASCLEGGVPYDVVFCRNLLIYLGRDARERLIARLSGWLAPHGLLGVGHAESLELLQPRFRRIEAAHAFALRPAHAEAIRPSEPVWSAPHPSRVVTPRDRDVLEASPVTPASARANLSGATWVSRGPNPSRQAASPPRDQAAASAESAGPAGSAGAAESAESATSLRRAWALADAGQLMAARTEVEALLATHGPGAEALELLGCVHVALGNLQEAQQALAQALYFDPMCENALLQLSIICRQAGDTTQAERYRQRAERSHRKRLEEQAEP